MPTGVGKQKKSIITVWMESAERGSYSLFVYYDVRFRTRKKVFDFNNICIVQLTDRFRSHRRKSLQFFWDLACEILKV